MIIMSNQLLVMLYAIWYHLYNFKNLKNTYGGLLILVNSLMTVAVII